MIDFMFGSVYNDCIREKKRFRENGLLFSIRLRKIVKGYLVDNSYEVVDVSGDSGSDFIETTLYRGR